MNVNQSSITQFKRAIQRTNTGIESFDLPETFEAQSITKDKNITTQLLKQSLVNFEKPDSKQDKKLPGPKQKRSKHVLIFLDKFATFRNNKLTE